VLHRGICHATGLGMLAPYIVRRGPMAASTICWSVIASADWAREAGTTVVFDANRPRPRLDELLPRVNVLITNATFPAAYTGEKDPDKATRRFMRMGIELVVATLGEQGCMVYTSEATWRVPGFAVAVVVATRLSSKRMVTISTLFFMSTSPYLIGHPEGALRQAQGKLCDRRMGKAGLCQILRSAQDDNNIAWATKCE